jgi:hypothetical protein
LDAWWDDRCDRGRSRRNDIEGGVADRLLSTIAVLVAEPFPPASCVCCYDKAGRDP